MKPLDEQETGDTPVPDFAPSSSGGNGGGNLLLEAALAYARLGLRVLPVHSVIAGKCTCRRSKCPSPGKHPRTDHGAKDSTRNERVISDWWRLWPEANIGMTLDQLIVIDVDGGDAWALLQKLMKEHGGLSEAPWQTTGRSNGMHIIYGVPAGLSPQLRKSIAPQLEIRTGPHSYVVMTPSLHASGKRYQWGKGYAPGKLKRLRHRHGS
ncbi:MAG TPA: bifunctional DNA primase/polymerase [Candidatus Binataceae bacterium]|nr:bifunctional DNA primase/polymerase [Candidatus Binataceae bacterium]